MESGFDLSVLMIDDNPADLRTVGRYLQSDNLPYNVTYSSVQTPRKALEELASMNVDFVLLDYNFPDDDGFDVLSRIRESGYEGPVVMLTGKGSENVAARAVETSLDGYLPKDDLAPESLARSLERLAPGHSPPFPGHGDIRSESGPRFGSSQISLLYEKLSRCLRDNTAYDLLFLVVSRKTAESGSQGPVTMDETVRETLASTIADELDFHLINEGLLVVDLTGLDEPTTDRAAVADRILEVVSKRLSEAGESPQTQGLLLRDSGRFVDPSCLINRVLDDLTVLKSREATNLITVNPQEETGFLLEGLDDSSNRDTNGEGLVSGE